MVDLKTLERVLAPIAEIGKDEWTFMVEGISITLRPVLPAEEVAIQRYAQEGVEKSKGDSKENRFDALEFYNLFRVEMLAYAIIQVGDLDLRGVTSLETGEVLESGKPVRVQKHVALRRILENWSRPMLMEAFDQYGNLLQKIEDATAKLIDYEPADLDAEIQRVERRLEELKAERETRAHGDVNLTQEQIQSLSEMDEKNGKDFETLTKAAAQKPEPTATATATATQQPVKRAIAPGPEWSNVGDVPAQAPSIPQRDEVQDSFGDIEDEQVRAEEARRILIARRKAQEERRQLQEATAQRAKPPHLRGAPIPEPGLSGGDIALATPEEMAAMGIPPMRQAGISEEAAALMESRRARVPDPAMRQPQEVLSGRGRGRLQAEVPVNQGNRPNQATNPRFAKPVR